MFIWMHTADISDFYDQNDLVNKKKRDENKNARL